MTEKEAHEVGVGSHPEPWPNDDRFDRELLAGGDRRNVLDEYRYWTREAITADLDTKRHAFHVAIENWQHDFNIGSVVRNANAFLCHTVHIVGKRRWNRRGAMVTDRYQNIEHLASVDELVTFGAKSDLPIIGIDIVEGSQPIEQAHLPERCILVFGQEGPGLSPEMIDACESVLHITQHGSTRSINAGAASAVAMYAWCLQHAAR
ncbi:MAG: TrmH family RNA methyltransferase [Acidimicrobiia bacterium]